MANRTVYPYGTDGSLPSSIGLVNDLKTGGVDKALTAEMGKEIGEEIDGVAKSVFLAASERDGLGISDEDGNVIVEFVGGHIRTKNFDSSDIEGGGGYNSIPSYFESEISDTEDKIDAILSTGAATIVMPIVTDNHIDWTARDRERVVETLSCIHKIDKDKGLDAVVNLGDIPTMWGRNGVADTEIFSRLKWYIDKYAGVHKKVLFANGNHDGESSDFFNNDKWYPLVKFNKGIVVRDGNSPYFYYDFADLKVRLIFMSLPCSTDETRTTEGITTYYPSEKTVHTFWGAGQEQLNWLANDALKTGDGWKVILLSHTPVCYNYPTHDGIYDLMGRVEDQADIEGIFNAYHNHTTYSSEDVSCDFTDYTSTKMLLAIAGHVHADMIIDSGQKPTGNFNTNGLPCKIVVISCQMMNRTDKTVNQDQYDYMVYNSKTDQFNFIRFGNGSDRAVTI